MAKIKIQYTIKVDRNTLFAELQGMSTAASSDGNSEAIFQYLRREGALPSNVANRTTITKFQEEHDWGVSLVEGIIEMEEEDWDADPSPIKTSLAATYKNIGYTEEGNKTPVKLTDVLDEYGDVEIDADGNVIVTGLDEAIEEEPEDDPITADDINDDPVVRTTFVPRIGDTVMIRGVGRDTLSLQGLQVRPGQQLQTTVDAAVLVAIKSGLVRVMSTIPIPQPGDS